MNLNDTARTTRRFFLIAAGSSILAACSSGEEVLPERLERIKPSETPVSPLVPGTVPIDFRTVSGEGFKVSIPAAWKDSMKPAGEETPPAYLFDAQDRPADSPVRVGVVIDADPKADVIEQSHVLEVSKTAAGVEDVTRSLIQWPGTTRAVLIDWSEAAGGSSGAEYRTRQLMAQVSSKRIINVVATAPATEFETLPMNEILATFVVVP